MKVNEIIEKYRKAISKVYTDEDLQNLFEEYPECKYAILNLVPLLNYQPERSKREDHNFWEAKEYDGKRPWHFKVFSTKEEAKKWVSQDPEIRKCRPLILDAVL